MEPKQTTVSLTPEELELLNQARAAKAKADAQARREQELATYKALVDDAIRETVPEACAISETLATKKRAIIDLVSMPSYA